jgi:hypothetical protein
LRPDKQLIELFLVGYNRVTGDGYAVSEWPDEMESTRPAVDAIAADAQGRTIAIEHTLVEPFLGEKNDTIVFRRVFLPLEGDPSLRVAGYDIEVWPAVGGVLYGVGWDQVASDVKNWVASQKDHFPVGRSIQRVPGLPFELAILILKEPNPEGQLFVGRSGMPETFDLVIERALTRKLPKLAESLAGLRILLLEKDNVPRGYTTVTRIVDALRPKFPQLEAVDEIWTANTTSLQQSGHAFFYQVWPGGVTRKAYVRRILGGTMPPSVEVIRTWRLSDGL